MEKMSECPVYGHLVDAEEYSTCDNCGWQRDWVQENDPSFWGGANDFSLNESRIVYFAEQQNEISSAVKKLEKKFNSDESKIYQKYAIKNYRTKEGRIAGAAEKEEFKIIREKLVTDVVKLYQKSLNSK